ncbi:hypothetical protein HPP92_010074 [Vanilla planifolia]|uniref:Cyclin-D6-1 n=1 Tax=Vanilla planifolia TaxID=51239 RepID=A0A835V133_VANPL|nr:hypothetical protein HPP92_010074 [Vanilla planifolia]
MEFDFDLENPLAEIDDDDLRHSGALLLESNRPEEPSELFAAESDHMIFLADAQHLRTIRCQALSVVSQAQFHSNLDQELTYLAVNYVDRFLSKREIPQKKPWISRLLAISCLSLASKMKLVDFSLDYLQREESFIFNPQTIQRMELLVLGTLEWRMRSITPFSFLRFFLAYLPLSNPPLVGAIKTHASDILFKCQNDIKMLEFRPSTTAAAALLVAASKHSAAHFLVFRCAVLSCDYLIEERVAECCAAINGYDWAPGTEVALIRCDSKITPATVLTDYCTSLDTERIVGSAFDGSDADKFRSATAPPVCNKLDYINH